MKKRLEEIMPSYIYNYIHLKNHDINMKIQKFF